MEFTGLQLIHITILKVKLDVGERETQVFGPSLVTDFLNLFTYFAYTLGIFFGQFCFLSCCLMVFPRSYKLTTPAGPGWRGGLTIIMLQVR